MEGSAFIPQRDSFYGQFDALFADLLLLKMVDLGEVESPS